MTKVYVKTQPVTSEFVTADDMEYRLVMAMRESKEVHVLASLVKGELSDFYDAEAVQEKIESALYIAALRKQTEALAAMFNAGVSIDGLKNNSVYEYLQEQAALLGYADTNGGADF